MCCAENGAFERKRRGEERRREERGGEERKRVAPLMLEGWFWKEKTGIVALKHERHKGCITKEG